MTNGFEGVICWPSIETVRSSCGEVPVGGAIGVEALDRLNAGVDFEAMFTKSAALSSRFSRVVRSG